MGKAETKTTEKPGAARQHGLTMPHAHLRSLLEATSPCSHNRHSAVAIYHKKPENASAEQVSLSSVLAPPNH